VIASFPKRHTHSPKNRLQSSLLGHIEFSVAARGIITEAFFTYSPANSHLNTAVVLPMRKNPQTAILILHHDREIGYREVWVAGAFFLPIEVPNSGFKRSLSVPLCGKSSETGRNRSVSLSSLIARPISGRLLENNPPVCPCLVGGRQAIRTGWHFEKVAGVRAPLKTRVFHKFRGLLFLGAQLATLIQASSVHDCDEMATIQPSQKRAKTPTEMSRLLVCWWP